MIKTSILAVKISESFNCHVHKSSFPYLDWGKINSYFQSADRVRCFTSQLLQKYWLALLLKISPDNLRIGYNENGKPYLAEPCHLAVTVSFNVSHSGDYVVMAFSEQCKIGIDIEKIDPAIEIMQLKPIVFSPIEQDMINSVDDFFKLWTKKEALIKAVGYGFNHDFFKTTSLNLDDIELNEYYELYSQSMGRYFLSLCLLK